MLKESMVLTTEMHQTVRIVHPAFAILEMIEHLATPSYISKEKRRRHTISASTNSMIC
jgi:hypothetical protein